MSLLKVYQRSVFAESYKAFIFNFEKFVVNCPRRDFAWKAKSRGGTLVTRTYIKESTYS